MSRVATPRDLVPESHSVLGTLLRPFSLGHHLLLLRSELPFPENHFVFTPPDQLALAVFICAAPRAQHLQSILSGNWETDFKNWSAQLQPGRLKKTPFIHEVEAEKFCAYLVDGYRRAPVWKHVLDDAVQISAPWECLLLCRLIAGGFSKADVLEQYLPESWYYYHTLAEIQQIDKCDKVSDWRKTFFTADDAARLQAVPDVTM